MSAFDPLNSLCEQDAQLLQDLGFNFMRVYVRTRFTQCFIVTL